MMGFSNGVIVSLKPEPAFKSDEKLFSIAVLTLAWGRSVPGLGKIDDVCDDATVSYWLNQWFDENRDHMPETMDAKLIDSLWFDRAKREKDDGLQHIQ